MVCSVSLPSKLEHELHTPRWRCDDKPTGSAITSSKSSLLGHALMSLRFNDANLSLLERGSNRKAGEQEPNSSSSNC